MGSRPRKKVAAASHFEVIAAPGTSLDPEVRACCDESGFSLTFVNAETPGPLPGPEVASQLQAALAAGFDPESIYLERIDAPTGRGYAGVASATARKLIP